MSKKNICMIVQDPMVKGGISAVVNGYRNSILEKRFNIFYIESYKDGNKIGKLIKGINSYFKFIKILMKENLDIIHIHSSFGASFYRKLPFIYLSSFSKKTIINHIHGADFNSFYLEAPTLKKRLIKKAYTKCSLLIALSNEWKENLSMIVPDDKIKVINNFSCLNEDAIMNKTIEKDNKQILFLGEIGKRKGCYDIPKVVAKVCEAMPNVKFILGGTGEINEIKKNLIELGIDKNIEFPGWVRGEQKDKFLRTSDIFFLPSYNEGMPMAILDAMGYGLPIVSTNVGGIPKIVSDDENGYLFEPGDVDGFVRGLINILKDNKKLQTFSKRSYEIASEKYSLKSHLEIITDMYNTIEQ